MQVLGSSFLLDAMSSNGKDLAAISPSDTYVSVGSSRMETAVDLKLPKAKELSWRRRAPDTLGERSLEMGGGKSEPTGAVSPLGD